MTYSREDAIQMVSGKKKFFLKYFLVSFVFFLFSALFIIFGREMFAGMVHSIYGLDVEHYKIAVVLLMGMWKILIIQFTLIPFIAMAMAEKSLRAQEGE